MANILFYVRMNKTLIFGIEMGKMSSFFSLYDAVIENITRGTVIERSVKGERWSASLGGGNLGIAMTTEGESITSMFPDGVEGMDIKDAAEGIKSWNLREAGLSLAAVNLWYNTPERMEKLGCEEPFENYCTAGLDIKGKTIAAIGHLKMTEEIHREAGKIYIIERMPQNGDYPDSACDYILPQCDIVLITGNAITNKTLPHLLSLCKNAYTILTGPSVPMCPALLDCGIDRLAGMVVTDSEAMLKKVEEGSGGSPYIYGESWLLKKA